MQILLYEYVPTTGKSIRVRNALSLSFTENMPFLGSKLSEIQESCIKLKDSYRAEKTGSALVNAVFCSLL